MRRTLCSTALVLTALATSVLSMSPQVPPPCDGCLTARYWSIPPDDYQRTGAPSFPEEGHLAGDDFGIAFSGGGTRSASATVGQLRGLQRNGWLDRVRYVSAASGGAWASIVFTYSTLTLHDLLGAQEDGGKLTVTGIEKVPEGRLADAIAHSSLAAPSILEAAGIAASLQRQTGKAADITKLASSLLNHFRRDAQRGDKTYARLLGQIFFNENVIGMKDASERWFSWDAGTRNEICNETGSRICNSIIAAPGRPFLIVGGTMVSARRDYAYPLLIPVEYTPLYIGARQSVGEFGGSYVSPWAYDADGTGAAVPVSGGGTVNVKLRDATTLTLADIAASTGAAPELATIVGLSSVDQLNARLGQQIHRLTAFFPSFRHLSVQTGGRVSLTAPLAHADGGAIDNLGLMPLLARQVHNAIVFVNTSTELAEYNDDLQSLFAPVGPEGPGGDKRYNVVFPAGEYKRIVDEIIDQRKLNEPQVACRTMAVLQNPVYNIRAYSDLHVCFVYNAFAGRWETSLSEGVRQLLHKSARATGDLRKLPYFATFEQNKPHLIQLKTAQVNLLAHLMGWTMTDPATVERVRKEITILPATPR